MPGIDWGWALGLFTVRLLAFFIGGFDKVAFVFGTFFIITSILSVLRQTVRIQFDLEIPMLVIVAGVLLLVARHLGIPVSKWVDSPTLLEHPTLWSKYGGWSHNMSNSPSPSKRRGSVVSKPMVK